MVVRCVSAHHVILAFAVTKNGDDKGEYAANFFKVLVQDWVVNDHACPDLVGKKANIYILTFLFFSTVTATLVPVHCDPRDKTATVQSYSD